MPLSFRTLLFSLAARVAPRLVDRAIRKLGYGGQLTDSAASLARYEPTLFAASLRASPSHGAFDAEARSGSVHIRLLLLLAWLTAKGRRARVTRPVLTAASGEDGAGTCDEFFPRSRQALSEDRVG